MQTKVGPRHQFPQQGHRERGLWTENLSCSPARI